MKTINLLHRIEHEPPRYVKYCKWDDDYPPYKPFHLSQEAFQEAIIPFPFAVIARDENYFDRGYIAVCVDAYPLMWLWWFVWYRLEKSCRYCEMCLVYIAEVWGLVELEPYKLPTWRDLFKRPNHAP